MNVTKISKHTIHYLETDEEDWNFYTRHSADNWSVRAGESDETVYDNETIAELEAAFQKGQSEQYCEHAITEQKNLRCTCCEECGEILDVLD